MTSQDAKLETENQTSAGGVVYRETEGKIEVAIILTHPERRWQLPKGIIDPGETEEVAALREVREEAGIESELIAAIGTTDYWFVADRGSKRIRFHKQVHWFLMKFVAGDVSDHDHEVAEARWVGANEALRMLVFKNEREIVKRAVEMIGEVLAQIKNRNA